jgi:predicted short-subunit dehydrogenase-like oxidoreductase (DUF2520 family)
VDIALVGPGRAGTAVALALVGARHRVVAVAGRDVDGQSTRRAAARLDAPAVTIDDVGRGAGLVVIATPDDAVAASASAVAPSLEPGALVVHLSGALGLDVFAALAAVRSDVQVGALHPLQTIPFADTRLAGAWAAVAGPPLVGELARELGMHPIEVADGDRAAYHAAAVVASNHLVALLGQVERLADAAGVPFGAFEPLAREAVDHAFAVGPAAALTGPVARGDVSTVTKHLEVIADAERRAYRALADEARRLADRDDPALEEVLAW